MVKSETTALTPDASSIPDRTRSLWLTTPHYFTGGLSRYGVKLDPDVDEKTAYSFMTPEDFVSFEKLYVYYHAQLGGNNIVLDIHSYYGGLTETVGVHSNVDLGNVITIPNTTVQRFTTVGLLSGLTKGNRGVVRVVRDADHVSDTNTGDLVIIGIKIEYKADM